MGNQVSKTKTTALIFACGGAVCFYALFLAKKRLNSLISGGDNNSVIHIAGNVQPKFALVEKIFRYVFENFPICKLVIIEFD